MAVQPSRNRRGAGLSPLLTRALMSLELRLNITCRLGESPVWLADEGVLAFVDITGRQIHRYDPASDAHVTCDLDEDVGCIAPVRGGGLIAGLRSGLWRLDERGRKVALLALNPEDPASSRFNDGKCDPLGRYWVGTLDEPKTHGEAGLYRYDQRGLQRHGGGLMTSNGLAFSADGAQLFHSDTPRFVIRRYAYDLRTGEASAGTVFARLDPEASDRARPDGGACDVEGGYWSALYEGARVHRYGSDGALLSVHPLDAARPTMPAFGGADLRTLFVTTAQDASGRGGGLFAMASDVAGVVIPPFNPDV